MRFTIVAHAASRDPPGRVELDDERRGSARASARSIAVIERLRHHRRHRALEPRHRARAPRRSSAWTCGGAGAPDAVAATSAIHRPRGAGTLGRSAPRVACDLGTRSHESLLSIGSMPGSPRAPGRRAAARRHASRYLRPLPVLNSTTLAPAAITPCRSATRARASVAPPSGQAKQPARAASSTMRIEHLVLA